MTTVDDPRFGFIVGILLDLYFCVLGFYRSSYAFGGLSMKAKFDFTSLLSISLFGLMFADTTHPWSFLLNIFFLKNTFF